MRIDEMLQHRGLRTLRYSHQLREFVLRVARVSFGDVFRTRTRCVTELFAAFEVTPEFRTGQEQLNAKTHLVRKLPGGDLSEVFEGGHTTESCKRMACMLFAKSGLIENHTVARIEEFATLQNDRSRNFCSVISRTV